MSRAPRRHKLLLGVVLLALAGSIWPGYLLGDSIGPYILGLPFSLVWPVAWIVAVFIALLLTFRADMKEARRAGR